MIDYIKRIQSNLSGKKIKLSRPVIREELELLGYNNDTLSEDLTASVIDILVSKFGEKVETKILPECESVDEISTSQGLETVIKDSLSIQKTPDVQHIEPSVVQVVELSTQSVIINSISEAANTTTIQAESEQELESGIAVSEEEKHDLIALQASELGIELSEVEVVDLASSIKDDFLDYESFIDEVVSAVVTYHDHRTDKLEQKIKDAREHIEYRRKQLNQTLVGEFGEMNNFFRQGSAKRRELSKVIAAAFKT
ncbi:hypothetical protein NIES4071_109670 (plasmid) [Calothrix sp. NIES-4071]|nr:hypothetical protein NIES4071_109670 [Calothrix sp. NIES-4071]BAZ65225.1 hypothetical protein NIES4105_109580 [Calothrix sp. NIES-4105]